MHYQLKNMLYVVIILLMSHIQKTEACIAFVCNHNVSHVFDKPNAGRPIDKVTVSFSPPNSQRYNFALDDSERRYSWRSNYASYSFGVYYKNLPQAGMNARGLVVAGILQDNAQYPKLVDSVVTLNELQFIQYSLDNFATTAEVIANLGKTIQIRRDFVDMHYLVYDASGHAAIIEFIEHDIVVASNPYAQVLTSSIHDTCNQLHLSNDTCLQEQSDDDCKRFLRAARAIDDGQTDDEIFPLITDLETSYSTFYRIVFNPKEMTIDFRFVGEQISSLYAFHNAGTIAQIKVLKKQQ